MAMVSGRSGIKRTPLRYAPLELELEDEDLALLDGYLFIADWKAGDTLAINILDVVKAVVRPKRVPTLPRGTWHSSKPFAYVAPQRFLEQMNTCLQSRCNLPGRTAWELITLEEGNDDYCILLCKKGLDPTRNYLARKLRQQRGGAEGVQKTRRSRRHPLKTDGEKGRS